MELNQMLLSEFDREMSLTRKFLERVPEGKWDWKPHPKSMLMGGLATHLSNLPSFAVRLIELDSLDFAPPGAPPYKPTVAGSRAEVLDAFDKNVAGARTAIAGTTNEHLLKQWSLLSGGKEIFTMPRIAALRSLFMNHAINHRAQLGVYLRLNDVSVPATYGPSADEKM